MDHFAAIATQRRALADFFEDLTDEQLQKRSLCSAWSVRDILAHLVMPLTTSIPTVVLEMVKAKGKFDRASVAMTARKASLSTAALIELLRANAESHFTPPGHDSLAPLTDTYAHGQDAARPLGLVGLGTTENWEYVLRFLASDKGLKGFVTRPLPNVKMVATDMDFTAGRGTELSGPGIALAMTMLGRTAYLKDLSGPGQPIMERWVDLG